MILNRVAAVAQAAAVPIVITTANRPIDLGLIHGPVTVALGVTYQAAALAAAVAPRRTWTEAGAAGIGCTWWILRAVTLLHAEAWTAATVHTLLALFVALFYWRSLARLGFLQRLDQHEQEWAGHG